MRHVFWAGVVAVFLVMQVAQQEEWDLCVLIVSYTMNKQDGWGKTIIIFTRDGIHHPNSMRDCVKPEVARHQLLGEVGSSNMNHYFPMGFHKAIWRLPLCSSSYDFWIVVNEVFWDGQTKELRIAIAVEATSEGACHRPEETECAKYALRAERFQTKHPVITHGVVHEDEGMMVYTNWKTVLEGDIHVHCIQVAVVSAI